MRILIILFLISNNISNSNAQFVDYNNFFGIDINSSVFDLGLSRANSYNNEPFFRMNFQSYSYERAKCGGLSFDEEIRKEREICYENILDKSFFNFFDEPELVIGCDNASSFEDCKLMVITFSSSFNDLKFNNILDILADKYNSPQSVQNESWGKMYSWKFSNKELVIRKVNKTNMFHVDYIIR